MRYSVVIPAFNAAGTITRAIESVRAQTHAPAEIIVVDDGSTDMTAAVVAGLPDVTLIRQANAGPGTARNRGVQASRTDWLAFLDADDTWLPHKMERQSLLAADDRVGMIHCRGPESRHPAPPLVTFDDLWKVNCVALSAAVVRRATFDSLGGFHDRAVLPLAEDYNLWLRLAAAGWRIVTWPETQIRYTPVQNSLTSNEARLAEAEILNARLLGEQLALERPVIAAKIHQIRIAYAQNLFWRRDLKHSRRLLAAAIHHRPSLPLLIRYLLTFAPRSLLDWRRNHGHRK